MDDDKPTTCVETMAKQIKILHLEDTPSDAELIARVLKKSNLDFQSLVVDNRQEFEDALKNFAPDIVLSDHSLPSFDSSQALKLVRNLTNKIPFILVTATMSEEFAVAALKNGADDYILKDRLQRLPDAILNAMELKKLENERMVFLEEIIANEAMMNETSRLAHIGSFQADLRTGAVKWSDELFAILGHKRGEIEVSLETYLRYVHPDDIENVKDTIQSGFLTRDQVSAEFRIRDKNGSIKYILGELIIERNRGDKPVKVIGFNQDISQIKQAQMEIEALNESLEKKVADRTAELEQANRELEAFNYTVSHDLRSPLQVINGFSSILVKKHADDLNEDAQNKLLSIKSYTHRMATIIDDLLNLSKMGRTELARKEFDMTELVKKVIDELTAVEDFSAEIKLSDLNTAFCDAGLVQQLWINLLSNAIKYSKKEEKPVVEIGMSHEGGQIIYYVKDNGVGFDAQKNASKLFKAFQRMHEPSEFEGTGVGLALVHRIVEKHGGKIWVEAKINEGAKFYFTLS